MGAPAMITGPELATMPLSPPRKARLAVLTGAIRAGKTTAALRIVELARQRGYLCGGFLSPDRLGPDGRKLGIDVVSLADGERRPLALLGEDLAGPRVGAYSFDQASLDWAIDAFRRAAARGHDLLAVDELGPLEFERGEGFAPLLPDLASGEYRRALAVVRLDFRHRLAVSSDRVQLRVFQLAPIPEERVLVPTQVFHWLCQDQSEGGV